MYPSEVNAECIKYGLRLRDCGSRKFTTLDLYDIITTCGRTSALFYAINPDLDPHKNADARWTLEAHLLARVGDLLAIGNWQRGGKGAAPRPLPRPGVGPQIKKAAGNNPIDLDDMAAWMESRIA